MLRWTLRLSHRHISAAFVIGSLFSGSVYSQEGKVSKELSGDLYGAERLTIRFRNYSDMTGDYRVNIDSTISIPVIGRVSLNGQDAASLEKLLSSRISAITGREGFATVEVAAYRPVYVTGNVRNAGAVQWTPGLTVLQAVALSGGAPVGEGAHSTTDGDPVRLRKLMDDQKRNLAILARIRAQLSKTELRVPTQLLSLTSKEDAQRLISEQSELLTSMSDSADLKARSLEQSASVANSELNELRQQSARIKEQLSLRREQAAKMRDLLTKGIIRGDRVMEEELRASDLEEKVSGLSVNIARVEALQASIRAELSGFERDRREALNTDRMRLERTIAQDQIEIESLGGRKLSADVESSQPQAPPFQISRRNSGQRIPADPATALEPGDVLLVATDEQ